ncbi:hypothetical protein [Cypionkella sp. TWP1-2-1b2]|uniref:hypothetical protein n=1 Tax=Cypionkella sp. TWP1-2-1b2 TaxID=2804675 RepID=UPI003CF24AFC
MSPEQAAAAGRAKGEVVFGFRPKQAALVGEGQGMAMKVSFVERIGSRTILHLGEGAASAKTAFENDAGFEFGRALNFAPHPSAVRLFDAASGAALRGH